MRYGACVHFCVIASYLPFCWLAAGSQLVVCMSCQASVILPGQLCLQIFDLFWLCGFTRCCNSTSDCGSASLPSHSRLIFSSPLFVFHGRVALTTFSLLLIHGCACGLSLCSLWGTAFGLAEYHCAVQKLAMAPRGRRSLPRTVKLLTKKNTHYIPPEVIVNPGPDDLQRRVRVVTEQKVM